MRFGSIGFTLLYLKMAMMPLVPETKMTDIGKLISLRNLLIRKVTGLVLTTTFATLILSRDFGADCITRIAYIYSSFKNSFFPFQLTETTRYLTLRFSETTHPFNLDFQRQHTLFLLHLTSSSQPHEMYTLCNYFLPCSTFTVRFAPAAKTTTEIWSNHRKKLTTNMGEDTFLLTYIIKIQ